MSDKAIYPSVGDPRATASAGDLSEPMARIVRDELHVIRDEMRAELREEMREQTRSRAVKMNAGAATASLYGGGALALSVGLLLALVLPGWAAFLIVTAGLFALALALRNAARSRKHPEPAAVPAAPVGAPAPGAVPPTAPTAPTGPPSAAPDPQTPHHRA